MYVYRVPVKVLRFSKIKMFYVFDFAMLVFKDIFIKSKTYFLQPNDTEKKW